jgi:hypothetical protein
MAKPSICPLGSAIGAPANTMRIRVVYTGFGVGREAFNAAILSAEGSFVRGLIGQVSILSLERYSSLPNPSLQRIL